MGASDICTAGAVASQGKGEVAAPTFQDDGSDPFVSQAHSEAAMLSMQNFTRPESMLTEITQRHTVRAESDYPKKTI